MTRPAASGLFELIGRVDPKHSTRPITNLARYHEIGNQANFESARPWEELPGGLVQGSLHAIGKNLRTGATLDYAMNRRKQSRNGMAEKPRHDRRDEAEASTPRDGRAFACSFD